MEPILKMLGASGEDAVAAYEEEPEQDEHGDTASEEVMASVASRRNAGVEATVISGGGRQRWE